MATGECGSLAFDFKKTLPSQSSSAGLGIKLERKQDDSVKWKYWGANYTLTKYHINAGVFDRSTSLNRIASTFVIFTV